MYYIYAIHLNIVTHAGNTLCFLLKEMLCWLFHCVWKETEKGGDALCDITEGSSPPEKWIQQKRAQSAVLQL